MSLSVAALKDFDTTEWEKRIFDPRGQMRVLPASEYSEMIAEAGPTLLPIIGNRRAVYTFPTVELIDFLRLEIGHDTAIEIACGVGAIAKALNIPATDSKMQEKPGVRAIYLAAQQQPIVYPSFVEKLKGEAAVEKYRPDVVIASWVTQKWEPGDNQGLAGGIDERLIVPRVKKYIHIGNRTTHGDKRIMRLFPHTIFRPDWLYTRSLAPQENEIVIFTNFLDE